MRTVKAGGELSVQVKRHSVQMFRLRARSKGGKRENLVGDDNHAEL